MKKEFDKRIKVLPCFDSWAGGKYRDEGIVFYAGLSLIEQLHLYVYSWNQGGYYPGKKGILEKFEITDKEFKMLKKESGRIVTGPVFDERTGLLSGSGYVYLTNINK